jgi:integrase/recombinase XerD
MLMPEHHLLGPYVRRFLLEHVVADRNLGRNTQCSYRDAIRLLLRFMTDRHRIDPVDLTVEQVTAEVVRDFLMYLKTQTLQVNACGYAASRNFISRRAAC